VREQRREDPSEWADASRALPTTVSRILGADRRWYSALMALLVIILCSMTLLAPLLILLPNGTSAAGARRDRCRRPGADALINSLCVLRS
jgi:hypothetical protein